MKRIGMVVMGFFFLATGLSGATNTRAPSGGGGLDPFLLGWRRLSSSLEVKLFANKDVMDMLHPVEVLQDPSLSQYSFHPFASAPAVYNFTIDYRFKPIPNVNIIFFLDAKPDSTANFLSYRFDRQGYVDGQFEINADAGEVLNLSARLTLRKENYNLMAVDSDHIGLPFTNSSADFLVASKGDYLFTKERIDLKVIALKTMPIQPRLTLSFEMNEYSYPDQAALGASPVDPYLVSTTGFSRIGKRFYPYVDGGVTFRLAQYRMTVDLGGYVHPNNNALSVGSLQSFLQWSGAMDITFFASKHLTLLAGLRLTQDQYGYQPPWQTTFFSASEADLNAASRAAEWNDQRNQTVFRSYVGFRFR